jgi:hypothetical protein
VVTETDLALGDGRTLHVYDNGTGDVTAGLAVFWRRTARPGLRRGRARALNWLREHASHR